jgi:aminopeptidase N
MLSRLAAIALVFTAAPSLANSGADSSVAGTSHRVREVLPDSVAPVHYDLRLSPNAEALTFTARVAIDIDVRATTRTVVLNAVDLSFDHVELSGAGEPSVAIDGRLGRATLQFGAPLGLGRHTLTIDYHGRIGRSTLGFFAMDYSTPSGPRRTLATNFEPAEARQLLPCWDEPARKATFTLSVDTPKDRMAVSNMPISEVTSLSATTQRVRFAQTPKMSTYLLFLGVGDFERVHRDADGTDVGVVVKRGDSAKGGYALDQAVQLLHYYNEYFEFAFPLPKLDLIAAPGVITGGAMENWGAIFYSQDDLLFDPKTSTEAERQSVFATVSHEIAHQWFGDLVTMAWWDDLWLNEGFASWMQAYAADDLHPEWQTGLTRTAERGKQADSVPSTHPVVQPVYTAEQAIESFDEITYIKGAAIIAMINAYVGRDHFREGVRRYMRAHAYGNTVDSDLWTNVQRTAGKPILAIERDFTRQEGLPLTRVTRTAGGVHLDQSRFAEDPATIKDLPTRRWRLPLSVGSVLDAKRYVLVQGPIDLKEQPPLLINAGQAGYTRVLYSDDLLKALTLRFADLQAIDQLGLLNDGIALGMAGYAHASDVLSIAEALPASANPIVWRRVIRLLERIEHYYGDAPSKSAFRSFALGLLAPLAARLGDAATPGEPANIAILRSDLTETLGEFGDPAVIARARERLQSGAGTPAELRSALSIVAAHADPGTFDELLARAQKANDPLEKQRIFEALADIDDPSLARRLIDIALSDQVPAGTAPELLRQMASKHPDLVWSMLAPKLDDPDFRVDKMTLWRMVRTIAGLSSDPRRATDLEAFEARSVPADARKPFLAAIASIHQNEHVRADVLPEIDRWIVSRASSR